MMNLPAEILKKSKLLDTNSGGRTGRPMLELVDSIIISFFFSPAGLRESRYEQTKEDNKKHVFGILWLNFRGVGLVL